MALLLGALDQTVVGTALPRIVTDLQGNDLYTWVVAIYLLTSTITVPFYGKLSDYYGRKPMLIFGIVVFLAGSALSAEPDDVATDPVPRHPGIGAGSLFPISLAVIGDSSRRPSAASTRVSSVRCSGWLRSWGRPSVASSRTPSAGTGSSTSTCRSA